MRNVQIFQKTSQKILKRYMSLPISRNKTKKCVPSWDAFQSVKELQNCACLWYNRRNGGMFMEDWRKDARHEPIIVDLEAMVPKGHLLRKIEKIMDFERLSLHYCYDNGRPGTDPVVFIKVVLIQHLFGIPSL